MALTDATTRNAKPREKPYKVSDAKGLYLQINPFDARCAYWSPFAEIAHPADADRIAQQLIPETGDKDNDVWLETSRILVANMLRELWKEKKCTLRSEEHTSELQSLMRISYAV